MHGQALRKAANGSRSLSCMVVAAVIVSLAGGVSVCRGQIRMHDLQIRTTIKAGAKSERLPKLVERAQREEHGLFAELGVRLEQQISSDWSAAGEARLFGSTEQFSSTFDDIDPGRTDFDSDAQAFVQLRQLWLRYGGLTNYPEEYLTLGLQRIRSESPLWWDSDIESLTWRLSTTRMRLHVGVGERFSTYRTNTELSEIDQDKVRLFGELMYDWRAYHEFQLRGLYTRQHNDESPDEFGTGAPDGVSGTWYWLGAGLGSNWSLRRSSSPLAYTFEIIGLSGQSDFRAEDGGELLDQDIAAWAFDGGLRYDFTSVPAALGLTVARGSGGFDADESQMFVQSGLHTNRSRFTGNGLYLFRFNEALRPDLTNLMQLSAFASTTLSEHFSLASIISYSERVDETLPIYRNSRPLELNRTEKEIGYGLDVALQHDLNKQVNDFTFAYWRIRGSLFLPGEAFTDEADRTLYRVGLELVGRF